MLIFKIKIKQKQNLRNREKKYSKNEHKNIKFTWNIYIYMCMCARPEYELPVMDCWWYNETNFIQVKSVYIIIIVDFKYSERLMKKCDMNNDNMKYEWVHESCNIKETKKTNYMYYFFYCDI